VDPEALEVQAHQALKREIHGFVLHLPSARARLRRCNFLFTAPTEP
jgi:hypothetical protein